MWPKLRTSLLLALVSLLLLECALQGAAVVAWLWHRPAERTQAVAAENTILCVGDSWTYGIGSSDPSRSYPMQLQRILNEGKSGQHCEVIGDGTAKIRFPERVIGHGSLAPEL